MELNPRQQEAVEHVDGPLLILAGPGSGKTRVLVNRIANLISCGAAFPSQILAVTFTNKAAGEMRSRVEEMAGPHSREIALGTFHSICLRILRSHHELVGFSQNFVVYDDSDQQVLIKECMAELDIDCERITPRAVLDRISRAKDACKGPEEFAATASHNPYLRKISSIYDLYQRRLKELSAADFGDLIRLVVGLFKSNEHVRESYRQRWKYLLVDEYQDTNAAQYLFLEHLASGHRNICVVGDDDQCLVGQTLVTMADGSERPIEEVHEGDEVLSCYGSGDFRPARVSRTFRNNYDGEGVALFLRSGRKLVSTPKHVHFAGYRLGAVPQVHFTYLMHKRGMGWRVGTSQVYTAGQSKPMVGFKQRLMQEHADALWVVGTHMSENEARAEEYLLSLKYQLPTIPFVPRKGGSRNGLVHDPSYIRRIFESLDTEASARRLLADRGLSLEHCHHRPRSRNSSRRNVVVTLCGDRRGRSPMHRISIVGNDDEGRSRLEELGFSVRLAKRDSRSWRVETASADFGRIDHWLSQLRRAFDVNEFYVARLGASSGNRSETNSLPFLPAASVMPGMAVFSGDGSYDIVERVERVRLREDVHDLNVERTHNFIANGTVTHNSIYRWRGADITNILRFDDDYPGAKVVRLEQNYRSTSSILAAAQSVVAKNAGRKRKEIWTARGDGARVTILSCDSERREAQAVAERVLAGSQAGSPYKDFAIFYRTNAQSRPLEEVFRERGIAYRIYGGMRFYERAEVKDVLAYLRLVADPSDDVGFLRIINVPARGLGKTTIERLKDHARSSGRSLYGSIDSFVDTDACRGAQRKRLAEFSRMIGELSEGALEKPLGELTRDVLERSGYVETLVNASTIEAEARLENINELVAAVEEFVPIAAASGTPADALMAGVTDTSLPLIQFLDQVALISDADAVDEERGTVTMMTLHIAKGLEFPKVFVVGMEEGLLPHARSIDDPDELEEERRLCYVGMTRAKDELTLSHAFRRRHFGQERYNVVSRFLGDIPEEYSVRIPIGMGAISPYAADKKLHMRPGSTSYHEGRGTLRLANARSGQAPGEGRKWDSNSTNHESRITNHEYDFDQRPADERSEGLARGMHVRHPSFGVGIVKDCQPTSAGLKVTVQFRGGLTKRLIAELAGLEPA